MCMKEDEILDILGKPAVYDFDADHGREKLEGPLPPSWLKFKSEKDLYIECAVCQSRLIVDADVEADFLQTVERLVNKAIALAWTIVGGEIIYCPQCAARQAGIPVCPNCGCTQLGTVKRGYSVGTGILGELFLGPVGLVAGAVGADEILLVCLKCRHTW